jgi:parallel beta-helix repeat protein
VQRPPGRTTRREAAAAAARHRGVTFVEPPNGLTMEGFMRIASIRIVTVAAPLAILALACSDGSPPTAATSAERTVGAAAPSLSVRAGAQMVSVSPGQGIQAVVDQNPPGTTYLIKAGVHRGQKVVPKTGDVFIGEPGAIMDGNGVRQFAFHLGDSLPYGDNVRIEGLVIQNYIPPKQRGAITAGRGRGDDTSGWVIQNCEIAYNQVGSGIRTGTKTQVLNNKIHHNDLLGVNGGGGDSLLIEGNEISHNNYRNMYTWGWELGGAKFTNARWLTVRNNFVHHNEGPGLWTDANSIFVLYEGNRVEDNTGQGIFHEISYDAIIRNNVIARNGWARPFWYYGSGIMVGHSPNVEVYGNTVQDNAHGIAGVQQDRSKWPALYGPHLLKNFYVHDNIVTTTTGRAAAVADMTGSNAIFSGTYRNRFKRNIYHLNGQATPFAWRGSVQSIAGWQQAGQDRTGTFYP